MLDAQLENFIENISQLPSNDKIHLKMLAESYFLMEVIHDTRNNKDEIRRELKKVLKYIDKIHKRYNQYTTTNKSFQVKDLFDKFIRRLNYLQKVKKYPYAAHAIVEIIDDIESDCKHQIYQPLQKNLNKLKSVVNVHLGYLSDSKGDNFGALKQGIFDIFKRNKIKHTKTLPTDTTQKTDLTYNLISEIRRNAGIPGNFDPRIGK